MKLENKINHLCSFRNQIIASSWFINGMVSILFGIFLGLFGLFSSSILIVLSTTFFLTLSYIKIPLLLLLLNPNNLEEDNNIVLLAKPVHDHVVDHENKTMTSSPHHHIHDHGTPDHHNSADSLSESDCLDSSDYDDGSISDEESLFEIALPTGHYDVDHHQCMFKQRSLMELWAEINHELNIEEDNLIEIDISMGSIKCSRFEIEA